jgi:V/A-type H+-transporting ATPase subunit A
MSEGKIRRISGSLIIAMDMENAKMGDVVNIGKEKLIGEVIKLKEEETTIQCYEDTSGVRPGEPVINTGDALSAELGPGLLGSIYDGLQRSESKMFEESGFSINRGVRTPSLDPKRKWHFNPTVRCGDKVIEGDVIGTVKETSIIEQRILVPIGSSGIITKIEEGDFTVHDVVAIVKSDGKEKNLTLSQKWPVRIPRPFKKRLGLIDPLITGQRVIDTFFPIAKGGTAAIPGGFGTGKTVLLHQFAKWSDVDVVIYIGCGERGNEIADLLESFPGLEDPKTGCSLMERTVIIANVSNMPVSAREASIYFGITIAEYYRDMGYDVALVADSTSRWAEALRDISGRLEEIPAEVGYPAYLSDRIAGFYERAARVASLGSTTRTGSVTIVGAVSPPAGDFSEPVTRHTMRFIQIFWALDTELAYRRHFPAINWINSYSGYVDFICDWWTKHDKNWKDLRQSGMWLLQEASGLEETAMIIGEQSLPDEQRLKLFGLELIKDGFLRQDATDEIDSFCNPAKQVEMLKIIMEFYKRTNHLILNGVPIEKITALPIGHAIIMSKRMKTVEEIKDLQKDLDKEVVDLAKRYGVQD